MRKLREDFMPKKSLIQIISTGERVIIFRWYLPLEFLEKVQDDTPLHFLLSLLFDDKKKSLTVGIYIVGHPIHIGRVVF